MSDPTHHPVRRPVERTPHERIADDMEAAFNAAGKTLTDDDTALVFTHTLTIVGRALEGAEAQDIINGDQLAKLEALVEGMKAAPRLL
ncbi:hypothetical protein ACIP2X_38245 [Streptomyces sp. NPDC089424]|uniref:hypothetical protein n=1 Tax=Streptomyces sp. NPDC089424 TaxID=3365917 RepID=UPI0038108E30